MTSSSLVVPTCRARRIFPLLAIQVALFSAGAQAQVVFQAFTEAKVSVDSTSVTVNTPAGVSQGDLLIAAVATDGSTSSSLAPPTGQGWTQIALNNQSGAVTLGVWWKLAGASEAASHQFTWTGSQQAYGWIMRFTGHDPIRPIDVTATQGGSSSSPTSPAVTTTVANTMIVRIGGFDDDDITVDSPGLTSHTAITMDESNSGLGTTSGGAGYVTQVAIGSSGTSTFSLTASEQYRTVTLGIVPSSTVNLTSSLTGFWKLNDGSGTTATDSSGNSNTGTLTNSPTWTDGLFGGAVSFDGVDDFIDTGSGATIDDLYAGGGTLSAWVFIKGSGETGFGRIADKASTTGAASGWALQMNGGTTALRWEAGFSTTRGVWTTPGGSISANTWYHIALVYDSNSSANDPAIYVNGVSQAITNSTAPVGSYSTDAAINLYVGNFAGGTTRTFDGVIDDVRLYSRSLNYSEIQVLASGSGLVGHWKLDDGAGTTAIDSAGGNNGTLVNGPTWTTDGKLCGALSFDGTNDHVDLVGSSTLISGNASFSLSAWFQTSVLYNTTPNPDFLGGRVLTLYQSNVGSQTSKAAIGLFGDNTDTVMFMYDNGSTTGITKTSTSFNDGNWHHLAGTYNDATNMATLYFDGAAVASADAGVIASAGTEPARIGTGTTTNLGIFNGLVDDVRVYTRALTAKEVQALAATYAIIDIGSFTGDGSLGMSLNDSEQTVGFDQVTATGNETGWSSKFCLFTGIGTLAGGTVSVATDINNGSTVCGWSDTTGAVRKAITWTSGGGLTDLGTVTGRTDSEAFAINVNGEVAGNSSNFGTTATSRLAFLYLPAPAYTLSAGMNSLGTLGGDESVATDVNDSGLVSGGAQNALGNMRPFRWQTGTMTDLGTLGGESRSILHRGEAINSAGEVVGMSFTAGGAAHAFLYLPSAAHTLAMGMNDLGTLTGGAISWALGINITGQVVGTSDIASGSFRAFIWQNGVLSDLNSLIDPNSGWTLERATDINSDGEITGWGTDKSGNTRAFVLVQTCSTGVATTAQFFSFGTLLDLQSGQTDEDGIVMLDLGEDDQPAWAQVDIVDAPPAEVFEVRGLERTSENETSSDAEEDMRLLEQGHLPRTVAVDTGAADGSFMYTVSVFVTTETIETLRVKPEDLELRLNKSAGPQQRWQTAGDNIGQAPPTQIVGDSGFDFKSDGTVRYWAVRDAGGVFSVGIHPEETVDDPPMQSDSPMCGLGFLPAFMAILALFTRSKYLRNTVSMQYEQATLVTTDVDIAENKL